MEQNHYNDDFEKMLRESTEDFRMYPSRKVWHSIYNDLHPDRKWPSLAICLVLLTAILHIGVSNNNSISKNSPNLLEATIAAEKEMGKEPINIVSNSNRSLQPVQKNGIASDPAVTAADEDGKTGRQNVFSSRQNEIPVGQFPDLVNKYPTTAEPVIKGETEAGKSLTIAGLTSLPKQDITTINSSSSTAGEQQYLTGKTDLTENGKNVLPHLTPQDAIKSNANNTDKNSLSKENPVTTFSLSNQDKAWIDNYAFYNKKNKEKWKAKFSIQYYITPSVGYRELYKNNDFEPNAGLLVLATNSDDDITQLAAANLEGGASLLIKMSKKLRFKTGLQLNLTNYVTYAHKLEHPTQTMILLNSDNNLVTPVSYSTKYGNVPGSNLDNLNNKTAQISMPIGADFKIMGKDKIKWYVGATIQPTRIIGGNAYLISSDMKNFASDASMIRKWNINSSIETFISYKMPSGLNINLGPQFRYQLMSTYNKQYTYSEKLYNIGLKIGLSSNF